MILSTSWRESKLGGLLFILWLLFNILWDQISFIAMCFFFLLKYWRLYKQIYTIMCVWMAVTIRKWSHQRRTKLGCCLLLMMMMMSYYSNNRIVVIATQIWEQDFFHYNGTFIGSHVSNANMHLDKVSRTNFTPNCQQYNNNNNTTITTTNNNGRIWVDGRICALRFVYMVHTLKQTKNEQYADWWRI